MKSENFNDVRDLRELENVIYDEVANFCGLYSDDAFCVARKNDLVLAISRNIDVAIDEARALDEDWDLFPLENFIRYDEKHGMTPDCDAICELAASFVFVR